MASSSSPPPTNPFQGQTICFAMKLQSQTRQQAFAAATALGATVTPNATTPDIIVTRMADDNNTNDIRGGDQPTTTAVWSEAMFVTKLAEGYAWLASSLQQQHQFSATAQVTQDSDVEDDDMKPATAAAIVVTPASTPERKKKAAPRSNHNTTTPTKKARTTTAPRRTVMAAVAEPDAFCVHEDYDAKLMYADMVRTNSNKFYRLQLLRCVEEDDNDVCYFVATNWGRLGDPGQHQMKGPHDLANGIKEFCKVFRSKTKNDWQEPFVRQDGKYQLIETVVGAEDASNYQVLGRLQPIQIRQGQEVLKELRTLLLEEVESRTMTTSRSGRRSTNTGATTQRDREIGHLSATYYSLIPTLMGRDRLPLLDKLELVDEKESLLESMVTEE